MPNGAADQDIATLRGNRAHRFREVAIALSAFPTATPAEQGGLVDEVFAATSPTASLRIVIPIVATNAR